MLATPAKNSRRAQAGKMVAFSCKHLSANGWPEMVICAACSQIYTSNQLPDLLLGKNVVLALFIQHLHGNCAQRLVQLGIQQQRMQSLHSYNGCASHSITDSSDKLVTQLP